MTAEVIRVIMDLGRINAVIYRHMRPTMRDPMRLLDMVYWPLLDITLWGFASIWLGRPAENAQGAIMLLTSLVLWQIVFRSSIEITRNLLEEIWHQNFTNLFGSPLTLSEWLLAVIFISLINSIWNLLFGALVIYLFFGMNIFAIKVQILTFFPMLLLFGWFCGLLSSSVILRFGRRTEMIAWSFPWLFSAFSCVFYPVSVLPNGVQKIAWMLPTTYVFENVRRYIADGQLSLGMVGTGLFLDGVFFAASLFLFVMAFVHAKNRGLNSLIS